MCQRIWTSRGALSRGALVEASPPARMRDFGTPTAYTSHTRPAPIPLLLHARALAEVRWSICYAEGCRPLT